MTSPPNVKDVARHAGVSQGTVSNVLNRPDVVAPATRERVLAAIGELGFVRNDSARQLRAGRSHTIAYVVLNVGNPFFTDVERGITEVADLHSRAVFLCDSAQDPTRQAAFLDLLERQRVDGVLITPIDVGDHHLAQLAERGMPVVVVDGTWPGHCSVAVDDVLGGELAIAHLLERGHRKMAFVGGPMSQSQVADRLAGARRGLTAAGLNPDDILVLETTTSDVAAGRAIGSRLAEVPPRQRPTAAFCANDLLALGLLQQAAQLGLRVPQDLAIIGYDDIDFAEAAAVPLTSVRQPRQLIGQSAADLLMEEALDATNHQHRQLRFEPELVVRASTSFRRPRRK